MARTTRRSIGSRSCRGLFHRLHFGETESSVGLSNGRLEESGGNRCGVLRRSTRLPKSFTAALGRGSLPHDEIAIYPKTSVTWNFRPLELY